MWSHLRRAELACHCGSAAGHMSRGSGSGSTAACSCCASVNPARAELRPALSVLALADKNIDAKRGVKIHHVQVEAGDTFDKIMVKKAA